MFGKARLAGWDAAIILAICADRLVAVRIARSLRKKDSHV